MVGAGNVVLRGAVHSVLSVQVLLKFGDVLVTSACYTFTKCDTRNSCQMVELCANRY